ncbi:MAG TPA: nucleotide sugar dehydrogenase [Terriglobia bacterium]|jgi:UDP-N-acetyl-D-glucosamine dehydrogenase|nr:nucleotide sugar dehydrogenase [Terriglobia bacterium]
MAVENRIVAGEDLLASFERRLEDKTARVGVVGLGYVGLPLALLFARRGFNVVGFDTDSRKVEALGRGETYIRHIPAAAIREQQKRLTATTDFAQVSSLDACLICVPTPLNEYRDPDLSFVHRTAEAISAHLRPGQLIVLESTTYPGTTDEEVLPILERSGLRCPVEPYDAATVSAGQSRQVAADFLLAFSPEREDPGNKNFSTDQIPKVVGGVNAPSALAARALYAAAFEKTVLVSSARVAEMAKILENTYRCVNIALINELKLLCLRMGIDVWEVIEAAKTKPFGFTPFYPGPGLGGHCIPIDPFYLSWKAREYEVPTRFIELAGEINASMPGHVVEAVGEGLNRRRQCLQDARILVLGVAYKKDIDDLRESPALRVIELLTERGARVDYNDPYFPRLHKMRRYDLGLVSVDLTAEALAGYAAVVIVTDHSSYDYEFIVRHARLVIDTRNATRDLRQYREKIVHC